MSKSIVFTPKAPEPIGPYSQAVLVSNTLYVSGQIALDPTSGKLHNLTIEKETQQVMMNLRAILDAAGMNFSHVVKCSIFLSDMKNFPLVNTIYGEFFPENPPARETVEVSKLPKDANVEISCIAVLG